MTELTIADFCGSFRVRQGSVTPEPRSQRLVEVDSWVYIGTGEHNDPPPEVVDGVPVVGVAFCYRDGTPNFPAEGAPPARFVFEQGCLHFRTEYESQPLCFQLSLYVDERGASGHVYRAPYGVLVWTDPDQVGVFGADDGSP